MKLNALSGQMAVADPSRAPAGHEVAWAYTHLPRLGPVALAEAATEMLQRLEASLEEVAPGFGSLVLRRTVQGPADLEASDANLSLGAVNGGTAALHQQLILRPVPGLGRAETPVRRLYLASAAAHPGGGVHGACGANAARAALAHDAAAGPLLTAVTSTLWRRAYPS